MTDAELTAWLSTRVPEGQAAANAVKVRHVLAFAAECAAAAERGELQGWQRRALRPGIHMLRVLGLGVSPEVQALMHDQVMA